MGVKGCHPLTDRACSRTVRRLPMRSLLLLLLAACQAMPHDPAAAPTPLPGTRFRAHELGIRIGALEPGPLDAITDVAGVRVGHCTVREGSDVRTGVTVILAHGGNLFREKVPAAVFTMNGFGKLAGSTQVQ